MSWVLGNGGTVGVLRVYDVSMKPCSGENNTRQYYLTETLAMLPSDNCEFQALQILYIVRCILLLTRTPQ